MDPLDRPRRFANFETPDLSNPVNYTRDRLPATFDRRALPGWRLLTTARTHEFFQFLQSKAGFAPTPADDDAWLPHRHIGEGSFGKVGCWVKKDASGTIVDELALKEIVWNEEEDNNDYWNANDPTHALLAEAVVQKQLNLAQSENIVHLRGYKSFHQPPGYLWKEINEDGGELMVSVADEEERRSWRFYLELAPYGDLISLLNKYRYWQTYLPEAFLWHVFDSLVDAALKMRNCSQDNLPVGTAGPKAGDNQLVNLDIKVDNVFLGYPEHRSGPQQSSWRGTQKLDYPVVKLGDFGLCIFTGPQDVDNPYQHFGAGTAGYKPPEQVHYGAHWGQECPNGRYDSRQLGSYSEISPFNKEEKLGELQFEVDLKKAIERKEGNQRALSDFIYGNTYRFKLLEKVHVWSVGKVLYDAMTLVKDQYWEMSTDNRSNFERWGHQLPNFNVKPFAGYSESGESPYSQELTDLIRDCLNPYVHRRLDLDSLAERTARGMSNWDSLSQTSSDDAGPDNQRRPIEQQKVYYKDHEINDMPLGKNRLPTGFEDWFEIMNLAQRDPDWPDLRPPSKYDKIKPTDQERWKKRSAQMADWKGDYKIVRDRVRRRVYSGVDSQKSDAGPPPKRVRRDKHNDQPDPQDDNDDDNDDNQGGGGGGGGAVRTEDQTTDPSGRPLRLTLRGVSEQNPQNIPRLSSRSRPVQGTPPDSPLTWLSRTPSWPSGTPPRPTPPPSLPAPPSPTVTEDPDDSDYEIVRRKLRHGRRFSFYRLRPSRYPNDKKLRRKVKKRANDMKQKKKQSIFADARSRNAARRASEARRAREVSEAREVARQRQAQQAMAQQALTLYDTQQQQAAAQQTAAQQALATPQAQQPQQQASGFNGYPDEVPPLQPQIQSTMSSHSPGFGINQPPVQQAVARSAQAAKAEDPARDARLSAETGMTDEEATGGRRYRELRTARAQRQQRKQPDPAGDSELRTLRNMFASAVSRITRRAVDPADRYNDGRVRVEVVDTRMALLRDLYEAFGRNTDEAWIKRYREVITKAVGVAEIEESDSDDGMEDEDNDEN